VTQTQTFTPTVINEHNHPRRVVAAVRQGSVITWTRLSAQAPDWDACRNEAEALFGVQFIVPWLGEKTLADHPNNLTTTSETS
jgi:hypothetical protein